MTPPVAIAMSGGVDSTMAAYLTKRSGAPVIGMHFITGYETDYPKPSGAAGGASQTEQARDVARDRMAPITRQLDIPLEIYDIHTEFESSVIEYFTETYKSGQTPNPCMVCNPTIKFGVLLDAALKLGAERIATGHYASVSTDKQGLPHLFKGKDSRKEQSYFLARLSRDQLARATFPLAEMTKPDVKELAKKLGISPLIKEESQDICFIKNQTYGEFLANRFNLPPKPGDIVDGAGKQVGEHKGLHLFTVGQRRGINCPAAEPYYVIRIDMKGNRLVVGPKQDLLTTECTVTNINWLQKPPETPIPVNTRVRYRHKEAASIVVPINSTEATVRFEHPQEAITPGQCAVFYRGGEVLGGGWITPGEAHADI